MTEIQTTEGFAPARIEDVGEGWRPIIIEALTAVAAIDPDCTVDQIKEKMGGLRLYLTPSSTLSGLNRYLVDKIVEYAEERADERCEDCGGFPVRNEPVGRWYRTLCITCRGAAWVAWAERMSTPASEFPVDEEIAAALAEDPGPAPWDGDYPDYDDEPDEHIDYTTEEGQS